MQSGFGKNFLCIFNLSGFFWCIQYLVLEKNCVMWFLCARLIWYGNCGTNLICFHCCDVANLFSYDVVTCLGIMLLWFNLFFYYIDVICFSAISMRYVFLLLSVALWIDMFYGQCCGISNMVITVWCYNDCISSEYTLQVEEIV